MFSFTRLLCAALFLFAPPVAAAASPLASPSPAASATPSPLSEITHVYTSDRHDETLGNSARTTYVVTRSQIARNGYRTIAEALESIPGVEITPIGAIGSATQYGIRGSAASDVLVLIDGIPAPGSFANTVELGNLPTSDVDRIEVVEGGGSTLYGTGAIGGIINVITRRHAKNAAVLRYGSFDDREIDLRTDHVQFTRILAKNDYALPNGGIRQNADYASSALHVDGERRIGTVDATVRAGVESDHVGAPYTYPNPSLTSREDDFNGDANLLLTHSTARSDGSLQFGGSRQAIVFGCDMATDPSCYQPLPSLNTEGRVDFDARNLVSGANETLLYGVDLSRGTVRADTGGSLPTPPPAITSNALAQTAAYVQEQMGERWGSAEVGLRGERDGAYGGELSPSAGVVVRFSNAASLKANAATAFRAPNASELYYPGYGNTALAPERAKVADLTLVDTHLLGGASLGWFANQTDNLILYNPVTFMAGNIAHASIRGLTFDVRTLPMRGFVTSLNVTDLYRAENVEAAARLPNDPVLAANLRLRYTGTGGAIDAIGIDLHLSGPNGTVDPTLPLFNQPAAFTTLNAYVRVRAGKDALVALRGYNLGNERYAASPGFPLPGRSLLLEVTTR
jgi:vitamin B12 transporter